MYRHFFLSGAQREVIETAHFDLDDREIARHWTLSEQDLLRIDRRRRDSNRFGFAVAGLHDVLPDVRHAGRNREQWKKS